MARNQAGKREAKLERKVAKAGRQGWSAAGPSFGAQMWDLIRLLAIAWKDAPKDDPDRPILLAELKGAANLMVIRERGMGRDTTNKAVIKHALKLEPLDHRTEADKAAQRQKALRAGEILVTE